MKKIAIYLLALLSLVTALLSYLSWYTGTGARFSDGKYLGYSAKINEWLLFEYQNISVLHDGPYVFRNNGRRFASYISGDGNSPGKLTRVEVETRFRLP